MRVHPCVASSLQVGKHKEAETAFVEEVRGLGTKDGVMQRMSLKLRYPRQVPMPACCCYPRQVPMRA